MQYEPTKFLGLRGVPVGSRRGVAALLAVPVGLDALSELGRGEDRVYIDEERDVQDRLGMASAFVFGELMLAAWAIKSLLLYMPPAALVLAAADLNSSSQKVRWAAKQRLGLPLTQKDREAEAREEVTKADALLAGGAFAAVSVSVLNSDLSPKLKEPLIESDRKRRKFVGSLKRGSKITKIDILPKLPFVKKLDPDLAS